MMARSASREKDTPVSRKCPCSIASTSALRASRRGGPFTGLDRRDDLAQSTSRNTKHIAFGFRLGHLEVSMCASRSAACAVSAEASCSIASLAHSSDPVAFSSAAIRARRTPCAAANPCAPPPHARVSPGRRRCSNSDSVGQWKGRTSSSRFLFVSRSPSRWCSAIPASARFNWTRRVTSTASPSRRASLSAAAWHGAQEITQRGKHARVDGSYRAWAPSAGTRGSVPAPPAPQNPPSASRVSRGAP